MTHLELSIRVAAILTTLLEVGGSSPETPIYMALNFDYEAYSRIRTSLTNRGLCTLSGNVLTLTNAGRELAEKFNDALKV